jgi:transcriptional regulator with XRE-family HTH domain
MNHLETTCNLAHSAIYAWKTGKAKPSADAIIKIAKYLNVTTDYLMGLTDEMQPLVLSAEQKELLTLYDNMGENNKNELLTIARNKSLE